MIDPYAERGSQPVSVSFVTPMPGYMRVPVMCGLQVFRNGFPVFWSGDLALRIWLFFLQTFT